MKMCFLLVAALVVSSLVAHQQVSAALPPVVHADMETTTNVPFTAALDVAGRFSFSLSCRATPSNNVEVAFGTDGNANGVLDLEEIDRVVGWDCGAWFTRRRADGKFAMDCKQILTLDAQGTAGVFKHGKRVSRTTNNCVRVEGNIVYGSDE